MYEKKTCFPFFDIENQVKPSKIQYAVDQRYTVFYPIKTDEMW